MASGNNYTLSSIVDIATKNDMSGITGSLESFGKWLKGIDMLKTGQSDLTKTFQLGKEGVSQWFKVYDQAFSKNSENFQKMFAENSSITDKISGGFNVLTTSAKANFDASAVAYEGFFKILSVGSVAAAASIYVAYKAANAVISALGDVMSKTGAAAVEYNKNVLLIRASAIDAGKATGELTEHLGGAASRAIYASVGKEMAGLAELFDASSQLAGAFGNVMAGAIATLATYPEVILAIVSLPFTPWIATVTVGLKALQAIGVDVLGGLTEVIKGVAAEINNDLAGSALNVTIEQFKNVDTSVKGVTDSLQKLSTATGADFGKLQDSYEKLTRTTGDSANSIKTLNLAMAATKSTGFTGFNEFVSILSNVQMGGKLADETLRQYGVDLDANAGKLLTNVERYKLLIDSLERTGKISADIAKELRASGASNSLLDQSQKQDLELRRQYRAINAEEELKIATQLVQRKTGITDVDLNNTKKFYDAQTALVEENKNRTINAFSAIIGAQEKLRGTKVSDYAAQTEAARQYANLELELLKKRQDAILAGMHNSNKTRAEIASVERSFATERENLTIANTQAEIQRYEQMMSKSEEYFAAVIAGQEQVTNIMKGSNISLGGGLTETLKRELDSLDAQTSAAEARLNSIADKNSKQAQDELASIANLQSKSAEIIANFRSEMNAAIISSMNVSNSLKATLGQNFSESLKSETEIYAVQKAHLEELLGKKDLDARTQLDLLNQLGEVQNKQLNVLVSAHNQAANTMLGATMKSMESLRFQEIQTENLSKVLEGGKENFSNPSAYFKNLLNSADQSSVAFKAAQLKAGEAMKNFADSNAAAVAEGRDKIRAALDKGDTAGATSIFQQLGDSLGKAATPETKAMIAALITPFAEEIKVAQAGGTKVRNDAIATEKKRAEETAKAAAITKALKDKEDKAREAQIAALVKFNELATPLQTAIENFTKEQERATKAMQNQAIEAEKAAGHLLETAESGRNAGLESVMEALKKGFSEFQAGVANAAGEYQPNQNVQTVIDKSVSEGTNRNSADIADLRKNFVALENSTYTGLSAEKANTEFQDIYTKAMANIERGAALVATQVENRGGNKIDVDIAVAKYFQEQSKALGREAATARTDLPLLPEFADTFVNAMGAVQKKLEEVNTRRQEDTNDYAGKAAGTLKQAQDLSASLAAKISNIGQMNPGEDKTEAISSAVKEFNQVSGSLQLWAKQLENSGKGSDLDLSRTIKDNLKVMSSAVSSLDAQSAAVKEATIKFSSAKERAQSYIPPEPKASTPTPQVPVPSAADALVKMLGDPVRKLELYSSEEEAKKNAKPRAAGSFAPYDDSVGRVASSTTNNYNMVQHVTLTNLGSAQLVQELKQGRAADIKAIPIPR